MGVKHLWTILTPFCERKPLFELQGKTLAIDLSCWIVDTQTATEYVIQPKIYLRNLYFRTMNLLLQDIRPVFVLEGKAPELKQKTIERRNDIQQLKRTGTIAVRKVAAKSSRSRFNHVLKECEEMLSYMGIKCVRSYGEAEAMCAYLNADGIVDGCVSQDNDCFLYGGKTVYRNFNLSGTGSSAGSIDVYSMEKTEEMLNLDRDKMIALALLCGCDYDDGLNGVGKEAALKLFEYIGDENILDRLRSWKMDGKFDKMEAALANTKLCTSCGHDGNVRVHTKTGCSTCCTVTGCSSDYKEQKKLIQNEIAMRKKAILIDSFPNEEIINEYLVRKGPVPSSLDLKWQQPKLNKFIFFMEKKVCWEPDYSFEKFLPLMTRWQLLHLPEIALRENISFLKYSNDLPLTTLLFPERIKKVRNVKSVASYEIVWTDTENFLNGLVTLSASKSSEDEEKTEKLDSENQELSGMLNTIEPQNLVVKCYPEIVQLFEEEKLSKKKGKSVKSRAKKKNVEMPDNAEQSKENNQAVKRPAAKRGKKKLVDVTNNRKIDEYVIKKNPSLEDSFSKLEITPKRAKCGPQIERIKNAERMTKMNNTLDRMLDSLTADDFASDEEWESDMSGIIDKICNTRVPTEIPSVDLDLNECKMMKESSEQILRNDIDLSIGNMGVLDVTKEDTDKVPQENTEIDEFADIDHYVPLSHRLDLDIMKLQAL
ncbi:flap endonuclease GEN [Athalia rosae]|uniref:flap endonuclease GEN n=1 Tax=Athalia rosae TaxID=37344 RepID=UPI00203476C5|nr:flap endonuclease GEN [Athalia rosae]XP_048506064.1 flap endonuclease GEN [Athalia rosae]